MELCSADDNNQNDIQLFLSNQPIRLLCMPSLHNESDCIFYQIRYMDLTEWNCNYYNSVYSRDNCNWISSRLLTALRWTINLMELGAFDEGNNPK
jgi:hypothetical protein